MDIAKLDFSRSWENPEDFPTVETDEVQVRHDMQALHDETKQYINETLLPGIQKALEAAPAGGGAGAAGGYYTPVVKQLSETDVKISFTTSDASMPAVAPITISLPRGPQGASGKDGAAGADGAPGMSAYEAAKLGGYTGTETAFYKALAAVGSGGTGGDDIGDDEPVTPSGEKIRWFLEDETDHGLTGEYNAEEGMTWAEFVESIYNTLGLTLASSGSVTVGHGSTLSWTGNTEQQGADVIQADETYYLSY